jgi:zinc transporter ZupT
MTALGAAAVVFVKHPLFESKVQQMLDMMLGVAAGVMIAASYWSLLAPALEYAVEDGFGSLAFLPVALGFLSGGALLQLTDVVLSRCGAQLEGLDLYKAALEPPPALGDAEHQKPLPSAPRPVEVARFQTPAAAAAPNAAVAELDRSRAQLRVRRMLQLIIAITAHNFPEGLAVGVAFGALGQRAAGSDNKAAGLGGAISLAIGIGIRTSARRAARARTPQSPTRLRSSPSPSATPPVRARWQKTFRRGSPSRCRSRARACRCARPLRTASSLGWSSRSPAFLARSS